MAGHLDKLTDAFDAIADIENPTGFIAQPGRFFRFIKALKAIVLFWREEQDEQPTHGALTGSVQLPKGYGTDADRRANPQMYQDPASQGRSLLDD